MILGDSTGLSPCGGFFALLFFGGAFGFIGMFIGVPTFAVIYWIIKNKIGRPLRGKRYADMHLGVSQPPLGFHTDQQENEMQHSIDLNFGCTQTVSCLRFDKKTAPKAFRGGF
jgi:hypothetical protein